MKEPAVVILIVAFIIILAIPVLAPSKAGSTGPISESVLSFKDKNKFDKDLETGRYYTIQLKSRQQYEFFIRTQNESAIVLIFANPPLKDFLIPMGSSEEIELNNDGGTDILFEVISVVLPGKRTQVSITDTFQRKPQQSVEAKEETKEEIETQPELPCGDKPTRKERVKCRLKLEKERPESKSTLLFLPEECVPLADTAREECIAMYNSVQSCWDFQEDTAEVQCVKTQLNFQDAKEEINRCKALPVAQQAPCIEKVKNNVFTITKFRMHHLEEKAKSRFAQGKVSEDVVVNFITAVEGKKIDFNNAKTINDKKKIANDVNELWRKFLKTPHRKIRF